MISSLLFWSAISPQRGTQAIALRPDDCWSKVACSRVPQTCINRPSCRRRRCLRRAACAADLTAPRWAGPGRCRSSASCCRSRSGRCCSREIWHRHYGKIAFVWAALTLAADGGAFGVPAPRSPRFVHAMLAEYLSFIVLLFALYVVAGGILVTGDLRGTPLVNAGILAFGTADRQRRRHHRRRHDPDPAADPRQRRAARTTPMS